MNLLHDPMFSLARGEAGSLPALFAAMASGEVAAFPRLRPHQRPAWHMFQVQLGALALWCAGESEPMVEEDRWREALRGLASSDGAWQLTDADASQPAFMQPPAPDGLKWTETPTPDALDMLITARNHDLKRAVNRQGRPEDWVYALVSLQTCEGYGGRGNPGIARMNGGSSSRAMLGLAPANGSDFTVDASAHWRRDVIRLLSRRAADGETGPGKPGGAALLWLLPWPEAERLDVTDLDPWFIEICRRVRLIGREGATRALCANAREPRVNGRPFKGAVGDPWAPVTVGEKERKSLTIAGRGFHYARLCDLLFSGGWELPFLAERGPEESGDMLLLAEAISRGNSKTDGFQSRVVPMPADGRRLGRMTLARLAEAQQEEIAAFDMALRNALVLMPARGARDRVQKGDYERTNVARRRFDQYADRLFFTALWRRAASIADVEAGDSAKLAFLEDLKSAADTVLDAALPEMPCPAIHRLRAETRARSAYLGTLRRNEHSRDLFEEDAIDDND